MIQAHTSSQEVPLLSESSEISYDTHTIYYYYHVDEDLACYLACHITLAYYITDLVCCITDLVCCITDLVCYMTDLLYYITDLACYIPLL
jgi:hypothetical protein